MKPTAIDIHTHVEFTGAFALLKKRYTEEEIYNRFVVSVAGRHSARLRAGSAEGAALRSGPRRGDG